PPLLLLLRLLLRAGLHDHGDVAGPLVDPVRTTLSARTEPLQRRPLVDPRTAHPERVLVELEVVLGVRDRALEDLVDGLARRLRGELQHGLRLRGGQPANEVHHAAGLPGRVAREPHLCPGFHRLTPLMPTRRRLPPAAPVFLDVAAESPRGSELAELVADHRFGDEHRDVLAAVVHSDRVADHLRHDHGTPRPRLDDVLGPLLVLRDHLLHQVIVHEGTLLKTTWHFGCSYRFFLLRRRMISRSLGLFGRRVRPSGLPFGFTGWRPPEVLPSPPPCGWSTGFIATPRTEGRLPFQRFRPALPMLMLACSVFPTWPTVALQRTSTMRISPDGMRKVA